jgi:CHAT domain-containing protein
MMLATLVCGTPVLLTAATCPPEPVPSSLGTAFQRGCEQRAKGNYAGAVQSFIEAAQRAHSVGNNHWEARSRVYAGGARIFLFQYGAALETLESAAAFARNAGETVMAGGANISIATIYGQMGNFALARTKLERAIQDLDGSGRTDLLASAYLSLSYHRIRLGDVKGGLDASDHCIKIAHAANLASREADAWDFRGVALLQAHEIDKADACLRNAIQLYGQIGNGQIPALTSSHLAELKWQEHQVDAALGNIDKAFATADLAFRSSPQYYPLNLRATILRDSGMADASLAEYRKALKSADTWRRSALPGDTTNIETVRQLNAVYQGFAEFAAEQSLLRHDEALASEALAALAENRAASLREQITLRLQQSGALPPEYLQKLGELQSVQARVTLGDDPTARNRLSQLETEIAEFETKIGLGAEKNFLTAEKNRSRNSLRDIQAGLSHSEALLSFSLGEQRSFVWAVTAETMHLYRLPAAQEIAERATNFRDALEHRHTFEVAARKLSTELFSQFDAAVQEKPEWLIVGDGALLDRIPFSALSAPGGDMLIKGHSLRLVASEFTVANRATEARAQQFLGIADPLYNLADSRRPQNMVVRDATRAPGSSTLGRLPGSQREIRISAKYSGMSQSDLLIGPDATIQAFSAALSNRPEIIHFAVHVVSPPGHPEQAALALSLGGKNMPELLTREKIASLRVPGSLVVLSGCASGQGQTVPSAGLVGLSRAWLLAGASAVLVSNWPTPDDSGTFFSSFYSYLSSSAGNSASAPSLAARAAEALQKSQLELQRRGGFESAPAFWAAYSILSKE